MDKNVDALDCITINRIIHNSFNYSLIQYINGGKPVACIYTLGKSVPSNAVFTDTWRGIQDNLTSESATDSLSAKQGKALKTLVDTKHVVVNQSSEPTLSTGDEWLLDYE